MSEKLNLEIAAAILTSAACGTAGGTSLPLSPDLSDMATRNKNLQVWETFRVYYNALLGTLPSASGWTDPPAPPIPNPGALPGLGGALTGLAGAVPAIIDAAKAAGS